MLQSVDWRAGAEPAQLLGRSRPTVRDFGPNLALPWVVRLRYGIVIGEAAITFGMMLAFRLTVPLLGILAALSVVVVTNLLLARKVAVSVRHPRETLAAVFVLDTLCLSVVLALTGGPTNPFSLLYLVQITLSAVVLRKAWTWLLGALATACFGALFLFQNPAQTRALHHAALLPHLLGMWIAFIVAAGLITFFTGKVSDELRQREREVLRLQDRVSRSEKLASLATLAAGAAHELGTPLGTIAIVSRELERYADSLPGGAEVRADAVLVRSEVERCRLILQRMSAQGAEPVGEAFRTVRLADLVNETVRQFPDSQRALIALDIPAERDAAVLPVQAIIQSLGALISNALEAGGGNIVVRAAREGAQAVFSVTDNGHGMPEDVLRRIAEPFFTTKQPGEGMGLGTFLVRTLAERLGGSLSYDSSPGRGTTVTLRLPLNAVRDEAYAHAG